MVFFDVESLFTNVPIEGAVQAALQKPKNDSDLANHTNLTPTKIADLLNLVKFSKFRSKHISNTAGRFMSNKTEQLWEALFPLS